jgi:hypothetical protein
MQAMKDGEGNTLAGAHILGFFRRICKLLFWNIKPVFVFDGGVPVLKRKTIVGGADGSRLNVVCPDKFVLRRPSARKDAQVTRTTMSVLRGSSFLLRWNFLSSTLSRRGWFRTDTAIGFRVLG